MELAKKWGASIMINMDEIKDPAQKKDQILAITGGRGPEVVVECSGVPAAFIEEMGYLNQMRRLT